MLSVIYHQRLPEAQLAQCAPRFASPFQSILVMFLAKQSPAIATGLLWSSHQPQYSQHAACCPQNAERPPHSTAATPPLPALQTSLCFTISIDPRSVSCYAVACHHRGAAVVVTPSPVHTTRCLLPTQRGMTPPTPPPLHPRCRHCTPHCASPFQSIPVLFLAMQSPAIATGLQ